MNPDLSAWRKRERARLLAARIALSRDALLDMRAQIDSHLKRAFPDLAHGAIAFCWPYQNEYDARHLIAALRERGALAALPVIVAPKTPLIFREWHPGAKMASGPLSIPYPEDTPEVYPDSVLLPMLGFDLGGYRLGYGAGYFDRTLAAIGKRPLVIGTAYEMALMETIHPQPHDIPPDFVVTERGVYERRGNALRFLQEERGYSSPACLASEIAPGYFGEDAAGREKPGAGGK